jgi:hypothetical protein
MYHPLVYLHQALFHLSIILRKSFMARYSLKSDGFVKSRFPPCFVIPAKAGIQLIQAVLGSRLRGGDGFLTFYEIIKE